MFSFLNTISNKHFLLLALLIPNIALFAQENTSKFWDNVSIGGGIGLNVGNGTFSATVAPSAVYKFNEYFSAGPGLQYSYQSGSNFNTSLYGASLIALANPVRQMQLSAEVEQLRYDITQEQNVQFSDGSFDTVDAKFNGWNTALFLGAVYRVGPATLGVCYNVLHKENDGIYASAFSPFVRVYF